jgi:hypothetical protein
MRKNWHQLIFRMPVLLICGLSLLTCAGLLAVSAAKADTGKAQQGDTASNRVWNGIWFTCEFSRRMAPPEDRCKMFDDEGFEVVDGDFFYLRNRGSKETACRGGKTGQCFAASTPQISVSSRMIGKIEIAEDRLWVRWMGCRQLFHFQPQDGFYAVIPDAKRCYWAKERHFYVARYEGQVEKAAAQ